MPRTRIGEKHQAAGGAESESGTALGTTMRGQNASAVETPLADYGSVLQAVRSLPAPAPGRVRVFRGQNRNYPQMLATGSRPQRLINSTLFSIATRVVAQNLFREIDIGLELDMMMFWTQAVAQHYGPGSSYLDVTHSLDVALWFALYEYHPVPVTIVFGAGEALDPANDILRRESWIAYRPWEQTAYLYVFDVPKWKQGENTKHGQLIDLAEAPAVFSSSARMKAQAACLLDSGLDAAQKDLSDCFAARPIPVAWPMTGAPKLNWAPEDIFPGPERDDWYRRFLAIPLVPQPDQSTPAQITMKHPLPLTLYLPREQQLANHIMQCETGLTPALMYSAIPSQTLEPFDPLTKRTVKYAISDATLIVAESPIQFLTPPIDYDGWNQALLWGDISNTITAFDAPNHPAGSVSLQNVLFEFSPLDTPSISTAAGPNRSAEMLRAVWVARNGTGLSMALFYQSFPTNEFAAATINHIVLDPSTHTIRYESRTQQSGREKVDWLDLTTLPIAAKPLFVSLLILRELSPILKAEPFPALVVDAGTKDQKMMVSIAKEAARLLRVVDARTSRPVHFLRTLELNESFASARPQGGLEFEMNMPYSKIDAEWIRGTVKENLAAFDQAAPGNR